MKKILSLALVLAMMLTMSVTAFATEITGDSGSVDITYTYEAPVDSYIVTIPDSMTLGTDANVSAGDVAITAGYLLTVSVSSQQYDGGWKLSNGTNTLDYTLKIDGADIENNGTVLTAKNGDTAVSKTLVTALSGTPIYSGNYTDTLTFNVSVAECEHSYDNGTYGTCAYCGVVSLPEIDLSQYSDGDTINITEDCRIVGDGNEYNLTLNIAENVTVTFDAGTSGVKLTAPITVADGKTLTLIIAGDAEHTVNGGISLGNSSNVIIEGDLTKENNKLTVTATDGNAGIGANNGVTAGDITIRNARVDATGSSKEAPEIHPYTSISGAAIGTSDGSMGNILIENSIIVAEGGYYESTSHAAAIGIGYVGSAMGNITLKDSQITARNNGDGIASVIGAGANKHVYVTGTLGDIVITNTDLNLSMAVGTNNYYAAVIGSGIGYSNAYVNMGKIIFTDVTQAELDEIIPTWLPSDFSQYGAYALGRGYDGRAYKKDTFGGVWVSDGNGGIVQIGNESGYYCLNPAVQ